MIFFLDEYQYGHISLSFKRTNPRFWEYLEEDFWLEFVAPFYAFPSSCCASAGQSPIYKQVLATQIGRAHLIYCHYFRVPKLRQYTNLEVFTKFLKERSSRLFTSSVLPSYNSEARLYGSDSLGVFLQLQQPLDLDGRRSHMRLEKRAHQREGAKKFSTVLGEKLDNIWYYANAICFQSDRNVADFFSLMAKKIDSKSGKRYKDALVRHAMNRPKQA